MDWLIRLIIALFLGLFGGAGEDNQNATCPGQLAPENSEIVLGNDWTGHTVSIVVYTEREPFLIMNGYLENPDIPGEWNLFQPNGAVLYDEPRTMDWRGVQVVVTPCDGAYWYEITSIPQG